MENKRKILSPGALTAPIPPAMVTVGDFENANVLAIAWTGILATQPPKTYISVRPTRHSYKMLKENPEFVINLPSVNLVKEVDFVGIYTGAKMDKFEKCHLTKVRSKKVAPPTVAECPIAIECRVSDVLPMGSHDVFVADIVSVSCHESIMDEQGKMRFEYADLLAYAHGEYYSLGEIVGRFGFSTDKEKKQSVKPRTSTNKVKSEEKNRSVKAKASPKKRGGEERVQKNAKSGGEQAEKRPFYENAPRSKGAKKKPSDKNKGAPHGRRKAEKK